MNLTDILIILIPIAVTKPQNWRSSRPVYSQRWPCNKQHKRHYSMYIVLTVHLDFNSEAVASSSYDRSSFTVVTDS